MADQQIARNFPATIEESGGANTSQDRAGSGKIARQSERGDRRIYSPLDDCVDSPKTDTYSGHLMPSKTRQ
jgi:hypothetical protein